MQQSKRFGKRFSSLFSVAAFGYRSRQKLSASILLFSAVSSVPTVAHALDVKISVLLPGATQYQVLLHATDVNNVTPNLIPGGGDTICTATPCTGVNGKVVTVSIPTGNYPPSPAAPILSVLAGARGEAKIETNASTINTSATINNSLNVVGTFRMLVAGELKIETSSDFNLRSGTTTSVSGGGTWQSLGRGGSKCEKTTSTGPYVLSNCTSTTTASRPTGLDDGTLDSTNSATDCTICRSYGFTDTGYVLRKDPAGLYTLPATGVQVIMTSDVTFSKHLDANTKVTKPVGGANLIPAGGTQPQLSHDILSGNNTEAGRFYLNTSTNSVIPCEPFLEPCANSERKTSTLRFKNMSMNDQVNLPATSTDLATSEHGVTLANVDNSIRVPLDIQPIDPVCNLTTGICVPGTNNDWVQTQGNVFALLLNTPERNVCGIVPFTDTQTQTAFLSVAGSALVPFTSVNQFFVSGISECVGLRFQFDRGLINNSMTGDTSAEKQQTCFDSPIATLIIEDAVPVDETYAIATGNPRGNTTPLYPTGCSVEGNQVTCRVNVPVSGEQFINCAVPAGGS